MSKAQTALGASEHNLATAGFRREEVAQASTNSGGVTTSLTQAPGPNDSIEADMVGKLVAKNVFLANLAVFMTGDKMLDALLDVKT